MTSSTCLRAVVCTGIEDELENLEVEGGFVRCDDFRWCKQMKITQMRADLRIGKIQTNETGADQFRKLTKVQISDRESQGTRR
jgi:hypothetical protein